MSYQEKYSSSTQGSSELTQAVTGGEELSNANHLRTLSEEQRDRDVEYKSRLKGLVSYLKGTENRLLLRAKSTGEWLIVRGNTVSGTVLYATEFWDFNVIAITSLP